MDDVTIHCYNNTVHGQEDLKSAFAHSCNTAFAQIGLDLDGENFSDLAEEFLLTIPCLPSFSTVRPGLF